MLSSKALQQAQAEEVTTLLVAENETGYLGVNLNNPGKPKPYQARVRRGGKQVSLGYFATAEEAALCVARTPEGQAAAEWAAPQKDNPKGNHAAMPSVAILDDLNEEGTAPPLPPGANRRGGLFLLEERARRACFLLESAERHEAERPKRQRMWACEACTLENDAVASACVACKTPRPVGAGGRRVVMTMPR